MKCPDCKSEDTHKIDFESFYCGECNEHFKIDDEPIESFDEIYKELEPYEMDELCTECHDPDCEGCNE